MPVSRRIGLIAGLWLQLSLPASAVDLPPEYRGKATDLAFAALLSMPGAEPLEGQWIIPRPADFEPGDEDRLIVYLQRQLAQGAELEAQRHFGTLLQHALRARLGRTALWLLEQGANPRPAAGDDALALASRYGLEEVARVLIEQHGQRAPQPPPSLTPPAPPTIHAELIDPRADAERLQAARERQLALIRAEGWGRWASAGYRHELVALAAISAGDPAQLAELLTLLPEDVGPLSGALLDGLLWAAEVAAGRKPTALRAPPIEVWRLLWARLGTPLDYAHASRVGAGRLLAIFPTAHLDELLDSGYAALGFEQALGCQLTLWKAAELEARWPVLARHFPDLPQRAPAAVLDHYRVGAQCWDRDPPETLGKLQRLRRLGATGAVTGLSSMALRDARAPLREAIEALRAPALSTAPRLVRVAPRCQPQPDEALYRQLLQLRGLAGDGAIAADLLQWVERPGHARCALLIAGAARFDSGLSRDYDSFYGPYREPRPSCPDPEKAAELWWQEASGAWQRVSVESGWFMADEPSGLILVEDRHDGQRYSLGGPSYQNRCTPRTLLPQVLRMAEDMQGPRLTPATLHPDTREVLIAQCDDQGCALTAPTSDDTTETAFEPTDLATLLAHWPAEGADGSRRQQYLDAVLALDRPILRRLQAGGVYPIWTREALRAVSDSSQTLTAKRRRIAWLFHDHALLAAALDGDTVERLRDWLPLEDWGPVLKVIAANPLGWNLPLVPLDDDSPERLGRLDCALQHAQQQICGGSWRVE